VGDAEDAGAGDHPERPEFVCRPLLLGNRAAWQYRCDLAPIRGLVFAIEPPTLMVSSNRVAKMTKYETVDGASSHRSNAAPFRTDAIDIPLGSPEAARKGSELEYKVQMKAGDSLVYSWTVSGLSDPENLYYDLHGEMPIGPQTPVAKVVEYSKGTGAESHGVLTAPIPGVHGWYLQNRSTKPLIVHLKLSGFYELVPPGQYGNQAGIVANVARGLSTG